jgi:hypothetical protein
MAKAKIENGEVTVAGIAPGDWEGWLWRHRAFLAMLTHSAEALAENIDAFRPGSGESKFARDLEDYARFMQMEFSDVAEKMIKSVLLPKQEAPGSQ